MYKAAVIPARCAGGNTGAISWQAAEMTNTDPTISPLVRVPEPARTDSAENPARNDARFSHDFLIDDPLDLIVRLDHPLAQCSAVPLTDVAEETWIVGRPGTTYHQLVMANCASAGFTPYRTLCKRMGDRHGAGLGWIRGTCCLSFITGK